MKLDLNLLVVFDAVAETGSVTAAAQRLSLSQPAVSHALNRLRDLTLDPLFVRARKGLVPTSRAQALVARVRGVVTEAYSVLAPVAFAPDGSKRRFVIAATDYAALTVAPALIANVRAAAPHVALHFASARKQTLSELEEGFVDLSFWGARPPKTPWRWKLLFREDHVGLVSANHPLARRIHARKVQLQDYLAFPHITVSIDTPGDNRVDGALAELGAKRKVAVSTHSFASVVHAVANSDLVASMPRRLVAAMQGPAHLVFPLPFAVGAYDYGVVWHDRSNNDPGLTWLREQVSLCA